MTVAGVILAPTQLDGRLVAFELGLEGWYVLSPRMVSNGAGRGIRAEPRMLLVDDVILDSVWPCIWPMFGERAEYPTPGHLLTTHRILRQRAGLKRREVIEYPYDSGWDQ